MPRHGSSRVPPSVVGEAYRSRSACHGKKALDTAMLDIGRLVSETIMYIEREEKSGPDYHPTSPAHSDDQASLIGVAYTSSSSRVTSGLRERWESVDEESRSGAGRQGVTTGQAGENRSPYPTLTEGGASGRTTRVRACLHLCRPASCGHFGVTCTSVACS